MVKSGEIISVDGSIISGQTLVDESSITGESVPVEKIPGSLVMSGTENTTGMIVITASKSASESRYAAIVTLVKTAQESRAPIVRLADKYAVFFTIVTLILGAIAYLVSHDFVRVLSVLVVATPCPLILATPIAIISGMSRAAKRGVIVKQGGALETLGHTRTMFFDKTGTITVGTPTVVAVSSWVSGYDVISIAASVDHGSSHVLARSLDRYAQEKNVRLLPVTDFKEVFGQGVTATVQGQSFFLGNPDHLATRMIQLSDAIKNDIQTAQDSGMMSIVLTTDTEPIGMISFADTVRSDAIGIFKRLSQAGISTEMLTGDRESVAQSIAQSVGIDVVHAKCSPEDKVSFVESALATSGPVAMIGDGVNDAPALARADVGIAIAHDGDTASSDAADIVILHGSVERVVEAYFIARKTVAIAKQGIFVGIGLSIGLMILAIIGLIPPLIGALLQEGIDVIVILGALRVLFVDV